MIDLFTTLVVLVSTASLSYFVGFEDGRDREFVERFKSE